MLKPKRYADRTIRNEEEDSEWVVNNVPIYPWQNGYPWQNSLNQPYSPIPSFLYTQDSYSEALRSLPKTKSADTPTYEAGKPIIGSFVTNRNKHEIAVSVYLENAVEKGDPCGIAYIAYLTQIYGKPYMEAVNETEERLKSQTSLFDNFQEREAKKPMIVRVTIGLYLGHLFESDENTNQNLVLPAAYLEQVSKTTTIGTVNAKQINDDLKFLHEKFSLDKLMDDFADYKSKLKEKSSTPSIELPPITHLPDNVTVAPRPGMLQNNLIEEQSRRTEPQSVKQAIEFFVSDDEDISGSLIGKNPVLKEIVKEVILERIENAALDRNTQTPAPDVYKTQLKLERRAILESELYEELNVARDAYQQYWVATWEILDQESNQLTAIQNNLNAYYYDPEASSEDLKGSAYIIWDKILSKHTRNKGFRDLRAAYPEIPYGKEQFMTLWEESKGSHPISMPESIVFGSKPVKEKPKSKSKGIPFIKVDKQVLNMLNNNGIPIIQFKNKKGEKDEISLVQQLNLMMNQLDTIEATNQAVKKELIGTSLDKTDAIPLKAVLLPSEIEPEEVQLSLYLKKIKGGKINEYYCEWQVIDFSSPLGSAPKYTGRGNTDKDAIADALADFGQKAAYPNGDIVAEGPTDYFGSDNRIKVYSTGENFNQSMAAGLSKVSTTTSILGMVLLFTPLSPLGAGLLFVGGVTGGVGALHSLADRAERETLEWNAETMQNVVDVVSGFIVAGKVANSVMKVTNEASKGSRMAVLVQSIETGGDIASAVLIGNEYLERLRKIDEMDADPEKKAIMRQQVMQEAFAVGLLLMVGYVAPKAVRHFSSKKNKSLPEYSGSSEKKEKKGKKSESSEGENEAKDKKKSKKKGEKSEVKEEVVSEEKNTEENLEETKVDLEETAHGITKSEFINSVDEFLDGTKSEFADKAWQLWKEKNWSELENLFNTNDINGKWPPNRGFIEYVTEPLAVDIEFDRYGGRIDKATGLFTDKGTFSSPNGASFESRALPEATLESTYKKYRVIKEIPDVRKGSAIPWFGQPGMGTQYELPKSINKLIEDGYIIEIP